MQHPATAHLNQLRATQLLDDIKRDLPPAMVMAAYERGKDAQIEAIVQSIIANREIK